MLTRMERLLDSPHLLVVQRPAQMLEGKAVVSPLVWRDMRIGDKLTSHSGLPGSFQSSAHGSLNRAM